MSLNYALLTDIYPEKKKKKKSLALSPTNSDFKFDQEIYQKPNINSKIDQLGYNPYESNNMEHYVRLNKKYNPNATMYDKDYADFLEWKKNKYERSPPSQEKPLERPTNIPKVSESFVNYGMNNSSNDEFNQLLLYVFTGIFILFIYDNIYKLGKSSI